MFCLGCSETDLDSSLPAETAPGAEAAAPELQDKDTAQTPLPSEAAPTAEAAATGFQDEDAAQAAPGNTVERDMNSTSCQETDKAEDGGPDKLDRKASGSEILAHEDQGIVAPENAMLFQPKPPASGSSPMTMKKLESFLKDPFAFLSKTSHSPSQTQLQAADCSAADFRQVGPLCFTAPVCSHFLLPFSFICKR